MRAKGIYFPLGQKAYAYVREKKGTPYLHVRYFKIRTDVKGGGLRASRKAVVLDKKQVKNLFCVKDRILHEMEIQPEGFEPQKFLMQMRKKNPSPSKVHESAQCISQPFWQNREDNETNYPNGG